MTKADVINELAEAGFREQDGFFIRPGRPGALAWKPIDGGWAAFSREPLGLLQEPFRCLTGGIRRGWWGPYAGAAHAGVLERDGVPVLDFTWPSEVVWERYACARDPEFAAEVSRRHVAENEAIVLAESRQPVNRDRAGG